MEFLEVAIITPLPNPQIIYEFGGYNPQIIYEFGDLNQKTYEKTTWIYCITEEITIDKGNF